MYSFFMQHQITCCASLPADFKCGLQTYLSGLQNFFRHCISVSLSPSCTHSDTPYQIRTNTRHHHSHTHINTPCQIRISIGHTLGTTPTHHDHHHTPAARPDNPSIPLPPLTPSPKGVSTAPPTPLNCLNPSPHLIIDIHVVAL
jgi:hypothetical protein